MFQAKVAVYSSYWVYWQCFWSIPVLSAEQVEPCHSHVENNNNHSEDHTPGTVLQISACRKFISIPSFHQTFKQLFSELFRVNLEATILKNTKLGCFFLVTPVGVFFGSWGLILQSWSFTALLTLSDPIIKPPRNQSFNLEMTPEIDQNWVNCPTVKLLSPASARVPWKGHGHSWGHWKSSQ